MTESIVGSIIEPVFATYEYDVAIGKIKNTNTHVVYFPDTKYSSTLTQVCLDTMFKIDNIICGCILPAIKYGCIAMHIKTLFPQEINITLCCPFNIYNIISKILTGFMHIEWYEEIDDALKEKDHKIIVILSSSLWQIYYKNEIYTYDLEKHTLLEMFGYENINNLINYLLRKKIYANVHYICLSELSELCVKKYGKTRFFYILSF